MSRRRSAFTLVEMLVVIAIIISLAALAAAFMPRVNDSQKMSRAVDNFQQWLLTAKMRAKRDGLATGIRFVPVSGDAPGQVSQFQYIQQPPPLSGGSPFSPQPGLPAPPGAYQYPASSGPWYTGGLIIQAGGGMVSFLGVDFTLGGAVGLTQGLVQTGDYLEINGGGVYSIQTVRGPTALQLGFSTSDTYGQDLTITKPTTNYRILRQPRILMGEEPLVLPTGYAAQFHPLPGSISSLSGTNVMQGPSGFWEILFAPSGAVTGTNACKPNLYISIWDATMTPPDINRVGIVGVKPPSGFIGAYQASPGDDPFYFVTIARESGM